MMKESEMDVKSMTGTKFHQVIQNKGKLEITAQTLNEYKK